jgi:hypothetical protein
MILRIESAEKRRDEGVVADEIHREETGLEGADEREWTKGSGWKPQRGGRTRALLWIIDATSRP